MTKVTGRQDGDIANGKEYLRSHTKRYFLRKNRRMTPAQKAQYDEGMRLINAGVSVSWVCNMIREVMRHG